MHATSYSLLRKELLFIPSARQFTFKFTKRSIRTSSNNDMYRKSIPMPPDSHTSLSFMHDPLVMKFVNCMMWDGKKTLSQRIFRQALEIVKKEQFIKQNNGAENVVLDPLAVFHTALENLTPIFGTVTKVKGGKNYQVPVPLTANRQRFLSMKWLITAARERRGSRRLNKMPQRLANEIIDAYNNQGTAIIKKHELHRLAEANRAFAHFRW